MRIASFAVTNYRSITRTDQLSLGDLTVLIGPNNQGKSNIVRAIVAGMRILAGTEANDIYRGRFRRAAKLETQYRWDRDFPLSLQESQPDGCSVFDFQFELTPDEIEGFRKQTGSDLNGLLPISLRLGPSTAEFAVRKQGPAKKLLSSKRDAIAAFLGERLRVESIPAVRTADAAIEVVDSLLRVELLRAESDPALEAALKSVREAYQPLLSKLGTRLTTTLQQFLPTVTKVRVEVPLEPEFTRSSVIIDDGTATDLRQKGDGVQSVAALSLIKYVSEESSGGRQLVLAVEEPEAHLHPRAIHGLRRVLLDIARTQQVVVTTHCPLLVNRAELRSNIIVESNRARPAKSVEEIRSVLGVKAADNLRSANVVLIVEGEDDREALRALLAHQSQPLALALRDGVLAIDSLAGGSNLSYKLGLIRDSLCAVHAFLDHDQAGKAAAKDALDEHLLREPDICYAVAPERRESEIEDLYEPAIYASAVGNKYGLTIQTPQFRRSKAKWSSRMKQVFAAAGKTWDDAQERDIKRVTAAAVVASPKSALTEAGKSVLKSLIEHLQEKVKCSCE